MGCDGCTQKKNKYVVVRDNKIDPSFNSSFNLSNFVDSSGIDFFSSKLFQADSSGLTLTLRHEFSIIVLVSLFYVLFIVVFRQYPFGPNCL